MNKSKSVLKKIDFIGANLTPTFDHNTIVSTAQGGFISALILIIMVTATGFFGQELFYRQKALVRNYSRVNAESSVDTKEFPLLFSLWTNDGINLTTLPGIASEFYISGFSFFFELNDQGYSEASVLLFPVVICTPELIGKETADYYKNVGFDISHFWCMDLSSIPEEKRRVAKVIGTPGSFTLNITIHMCNNATTPNCGWIMRKHGNLQFVISFIDRFVDISSFDNPVQTKLDNYIILMSSQLESNMKVSISRNFLLSDVGYIFSEQREEQYTSFYNFERNFSSLNETTKQVLSVEFFADTKENYIERQYLKIQEFLANMGGFFKGILFLANFVNYPNSFTSIINQIKVAENKHVSEVNNKIPFKNKVSRENPRINESEQEMAREIPPNEERLSICTFLKRVLCCKLKEITTLRNNSMVCLDLQEMIRQRITVNLLMEKVQALESASK